MVITPDWLWGDVGSNPAQGKLSFKHLLFIYIYIYIYIYKEKQAIEKTGENNKLAT